MSVALRTYYRGATLATLVNGLNGERRTYHLDHQGTVQCLTNAQGVVTDRFACDAWGNEFRRTGPSINRQWYIGNLGYYRQVDQALDYVRARWLDPRVGQWLSSDPLLRIPLPLLRHRSTRTLVPRLEGYSKSQSWRFAYPHPTNAVDPTGLQSTTCHIIGILGKGQNPWDQPPQVVARAIALMSAAGWRVGLFSSNQPGGTQLNTLQPNQVIRDYLQRISQTECCWCAVAYSRGGGQLWNVAGTYATQKFPLLEALTIEAIHVKPAFFDLTSTPVTTRIPGAKHHGHWYAQWDTWFVQGANIPTADFSYQVPDATHETIQDMIPASELTYHLQKRCIL